MAVRQCYHDNNLGNVSMTTMQYNNEMLISFLPNIAITVSDFIISIDPLAIK